VPSAGSWAWLAFAQFQVSPHARARCWRTEPGRNAPPEATLLAVYPQISGSRCRRRVTFCDRRLSLRWFEPSTWQAGMSVASS
jgi:hypothetical protein